MLDKRRIEGKDALLLLLKLHSAMCCRSNALLMQPAPTSSLAVNLTVFADRLSTELPRC